MIIHFACLLHHGHVGYAYKYIFHASFNAPLPHD